MKAECPSLRVKAKSRANFSWAVPGHRRFAREVEDQDSGNLTLNHSPAERRSPTIDAVSNCDHDSAMRTSLRRRAGAKVGNIFSFSKARCYDPRTKAKRRGQFRPRLLLYRYRVMKSYF